MAQSTEPLETAVDLQRRLVSVVGGRDADVLGLGDGVTQVLPGLAERDLAVVTGKLARLQLGRPAACDGRVQEKDRQHGGNGQGDDQACRAPVPGHDWIVNPAA